MEEIEKELNIKIREAMDGVVIEELKSIQGFKGVMPEEEFERLNRMIPLVAKGAFLEGYKTGAEAMGVKFDPQTD